MTAENWTICPRCLKRYEKERASIYGNVPEDKYLDEVKRIEEKMKTLVFREDYELGVLENGEFYISYRGRCEECGLRKEFKHSENILDGEP